MRKIPENRNAFANREEWRAWLEEYSASKPEAWLFISRQGADRRFLILDEAVEEALCFGWIDGALKPITEKFDGWAC